jgi:hypothetical protein
MHIDHLFEHLIYIKNLNVTNNTYIRGSLILSPNSTKFKCIRNKILNK